MEVELHVIYLRFLHALHVLVDRLVYLLLHLVVKGLVVDHLVMGTLTLHRALVLPTAQLYAVASLGCLMVVVAY